jgi:hypothetical protein
MTKFIDQAFCALLALAAAGHLLGTFLFSEIGNALFVWSLSGVLAAALVVAFNVLRVMRPHDQPVAWLAASGSACWIGIVLLFGLSISNVLDPRVLFHLVAAVGLLLFGIRTLRYQGRLSGHERLR